MRLIYLILIFVCFKVSFSGIVAVDGEEDAPLLGHRHLRQGPSSPLLNLMEYFGIVPSSSCVKADEAAMRELRSGKGKDGDGDGDVKSFIPDNSVQSNRIHKTKPETAKSSLRGSNVRARPSVLEYLERMSQRALKNDAKTSPKDGITGTPKAKRGAARVGDTTGIPSFAPSAQPTSPTFTPTPRPSSPTAVPTLKPTKAKPAAKIAPDLTDPDPIVAKISNAKRGVAKGGATASPNSAKNPKGQGKTVPMKHTAL